MDREWFQVVRSGTILLDNLNEDQANAGAGALAQDSDELVYVVRCRRTDVRSYQREVTVSPTDVLTGQEPS